MNRATLVCMMLLACDGPTTAAEQGISIDLSFAADALAAPGVPLFWSLQVDWPGGIAENQGPYNEGESMTLTAVPNGPDRHVRVELFADGHIYYHGRTGPFELTDDTQRIAVVLVSSPAGSINIIGAAGAGEDAADITHSAKVTVNFSVRVGTAVSMSNDPATVTTAGVGRDLTDLVPAGGGYRWQDWQLGATPCCDASQADRSACATSDECKQPTSVYAVLFDAEGYHSPVLEAQIAFDDENWSCQGIGSGTCTPACGNKLASPCDDLFLVDAASPAAHSTQDGLTWPSAFADLQAALAAATDNDEIWVAAGAYRPAGLGRESTFQLKDGVGLYGGFAGNEATRDQRDWQTNHSVLSGDLDGNPTTNDPAYHVVVAGDVTAATVLDGVTITGGQADGGNEDNYGGGMFIRDGHPTIRNCRFADNSANLGGGLFVLGGSPLVIDTIFIDNRALTAGGGVAVRSTEATPTIEGCRFLDNTVSGAPGPDDIWGGAGLFVDRLYPTAAAPLTVRRCHFVGNEATNAPGGAIYTYASPATVTPPRTVVVSSLFVDNRALNGGAVANRGGATVELINTTMAFNCGYWHRNDAAPVPIEECVFGPEYQGAIYNHDGAPTVTMDNSIMWNNAPTELYGTIDVTYSCVAGGATGAGNIDCDPGFADADGADDIPGTADDDLRLGAGSPAIDAGDNREVPAESTLDLDGEARFVDDSTTADTGIGGLVVDMGAYEYH